MYLQAIGGGGRARVQSSSTDRSIVYGATATVFFGGTARRGKGRVRSTMSHTSWRGAAALAILRSRAQQEIAEQRSSNAKSEQMRQWAGVGVTQVCSWHRDTSNTVVTARL
jgi:hypothetical protein